MSKTHHYARLVAFTAIAAAVWLVALPRLAATPAVRDAAERHERLGVDPGALFYSDHPRAWRAVSFSDRSARRGDR